MKILLENKEHNTKAELHLREDIIQPGVFKDVTKHLCKCGGKCGCSQLGHHTCRCRERGMHLEVSVCKDAHGETYALVIDDARHTCEG